MTGPVKRYVVFAYDEFYPGGGWSDHVGSYDTMDEAREEARRQRGDKRRSFVDLIDLHTGEEWYDAL